MTSLPRGSRSQRDVRVGVIAMIVGTLPVALTALYFAWRYLAVPDEMALTVATDLLMPVLGLAGAALAAGAARLGRTPMRRAWAWLAAGAVAYLLGDTLWAILELTGGEPPDVSVADLFYLLFYPLAMLGLFAIPGDHLAGPRRVLRLIDIMIVVVAAGMLEWVLTIGPIAGDTTLAPSALLVGIAYPIGDLGLLVGLLDAVLGRNRRWTRIGLALLSAGLLVNLVADLLVQSAWLEDSYASGGLFDAGFMVFWCLFALSAAVAINEDGESTASAAEHTDGQSILPYAAVVLALVLVVVDAALDASAPHMVLTGGVTLILALTMIRQRATARELERLAASRAALAAEARFNALLRQASDMVTIVDGEGLISFESGREDRYAPAARLGDAAHPDDVDALGRFLAQLARDPLAPPSLGWRLRGLAGEWREVESLGVNLVGIAGVDGLVITTRDVTERRAMEAELAHARRQEAIGRLAGGIAHEFNNIVQGIDGATRLLRETLGPDDTRQEDLTRILDAATRAAAVTASLQRFAGQGTLPVGPVSVEAVLERVHATGNITLPPAGPPPEVEAVISNERGLEQVIRLLTEGSPHQPASPREVALRVELDGTCRVPVASRGHLVLEVAAPAELEDPVARARVFEPFYTSGSLADLAGLGPAEAMGLARQMGAWVTVVSSPDRGPRFEIHLPLA